MDKKQFGKLLVTLREINHISQKRLAELLFVSPPAVCKWEKGENLPSRELRIRIAEIFNVSTKEIEYPEYLLKKLSLGSEKYDKSYFVSPNGSDPIHDKDLKATVNPSESNRDLNILEVSLADIPTDGSEDNINDILPEIEQVKVKPIKLNQIRRKPIILSIIVLVVFVLIYEVYINKKSSHDEIQNDLQIKESFERYIDDPTWGYIYEAIYIVDDLPDYEWMDAYGNERLAYLLV